MLVPLPPARSHAWLCGQVTDQLALADEVLQAALCQVDGGELESVPVSQVPQVAELLSAAVVVVEAVDPDDLGVLIEERRCKMRADEPGAACDQDAAGTKTVFTFAHHRGSLGEETGAVNRLGWILGRGW